MELDRWRSCSAKLPHIHEHIVCSVGRILTIVGTPGSLYYLARNMLVSAQDSRRKWTQKWSSGLKCRHACIIYAVTHQSSSQVSLTSQARPERHEEKIRHRLVPFLFSFSFPFSLAIFALWSLWKLEMQLYPRSLVSLPILFSPFS